MKQKSIRRIAAVGALVFGVLILNFFNAAEAPAQQKTGATQAVAPAPPPAQQPAGQKSISGKEAFDMVAKEAEKGDLQAMFALATLYEQGIGTPRNYTKAVDWHHKAAVSNHPPSIYQLGLAYELGKGVTANRATALNNFKKAAELNVPEAFYKMASIAMAGTAPKPDEKKALEHLKGAGVTGGRALEALGNFYENGVGLTPNYTQALAYYKKAAEAGLLEAMFKVANCYETGIGTPVNPQEALAVYQKASDSGSAAAAYRLAEIYMSGELVGGTDQTRALQYMHAAVEKGHADAANELGVIYLQGLLGREADANLAADMFLKSAELGNPEAMKNMAVMFRNGIGRAPDAPRALRWYIIAQKAGYQPENIGQIISELKKELTPEVAAQCEAEADQWLKARHQG